MLVILTMVLHVGSAFLPVGLLTILAVADACDGAQLDDLRGL
ncbi:MAG: hypothetical protein ABIR79_06615 [Candidatus Binatia bacterium]